MNYKIKPLIWSENITATEWVASGARDTVFMITKWDESTFKINTGIYSTGRYDSLENAKQANQAIHDKAVNDYINRWCEIPDVIDSKAFVVSQIGAVENLIKCAREGGDLGNWWCGWWTVYTAGVSGCKLGDTGAEIQPMEKRKSKEDVI